jgi:hypothetical protein
MQWTCTHKNDVVHRNHFFIQFQKGPGGRLPDPMMSRMDHQEHPRPQTLYDNEVS